ncbi:MAG: hypothetical protein AAB785_02255 [Patescibacteria group bacterium]
MEVKGILSSQLKINKLSHAYLCIGELSIEFLLNLFKISKSDLFLIDQSPIKIGFVRQLSSWIILTPHSSKYKLAIILNAENLTLEASNALLKVLEEPPKNSIIVLQAKKKMRILPTIISRCQIIKNFNFQEITSSSPCGYVTYEKIARENLKSRFELAGRLAIADSLPQILDLWEQELRVKLLKGDNNLAILESIRKARSLLSTNISVKLLLENLLIKF